MVPSLWYTGYGAFTWVHWIWCLHMGTLAMVPSRPGYTGYGAFTGYTIASYGALVHYS